MRIGIVITRAANVEPTWTTAHIACALLAAGHDVRFIEGFDFEVDAASRVVCRTHAFDPPGPDRVGLCRALRERTAPRRYLELAKLDLLLLRINPMDTAVLTFASLAERLGVTVLNSPTTILRTSHKGYVSTLAGVPRPRTMVSRSRSALHAFAVEMSEGAVVKPARSSGGKGIFHVGRGQYAELDRAIDQARKQGDGYVVVQEYLPAAERGEKRLVWLDGELLGGYLRQRAPGEFRHNLKRGGRPESCEITAQDRILIETLTPTLRADGVWLAGIDVIGDKVVEVNTLNPGGLHLIQLFAGRDLTQPIVSGLESKKLS